MNQNEKISIIVPAYNVQNYIKKCIESLINQTYKNLEIIVINDGSSDNTLNVLEEYAKKDERIILINQKNHGVSESRNVGLKNASGDYVTFLDSDDWLELNFCEVLLSVFLKEQADILLFGYIREFEKGSYNKNVFDDDKKIFLGEEIKTKIHRRIIGPYTLEELANPTKLYVLSSVCLKAYKRKILENIYFRDLKEVGTAGEDAFFNLDAVLKANKIVWIKQYLYHYRKYSPASLTKLVDNEILDKCKRPYFLFKKIINEKGFDETYLKALDNEIAVGFLMDGMKILNMKGKLNNKYRIIKSFLFDDIYHNALMKLNTSSMKIHWRFFYWNAKHQKSIVVYFLLNCITVISKLK